MKMTKLFKKIENAVGKGEIAHYEQFLLYPLGFQKTCTADTLKPELFWKRVKWVGGASKSCDSETVNRNMLHEFPDLYFLHSQMTSLELGEVMTLTNDSSTSASSVDWSTFSKNLLYGDLVFPWIKKKTNTL